MHVFIGTLHYIRSYEMVLYVSEFSHDDGFLSILSHHFCFFKNKFSFFILLGLFISFFILPTENFMALTTCYICNRVKTCHKLPIFFFTSCYIDKIAYKKRAPMSSLCLSYLNLFKIIYSINNNKMMYEYLK